MSFRLEDGSTLVVGDDEIGRVSEALWELSATPGAISCAAQLDHARRQTVDRSVELPGRESLALRLALAHIRASRQRL